MPRIVRIPGAERQPPHYARVCPNDNESTTLLTKDALLACAYFGKHITTATLHRWLYSHDGEKLYHQPSGHGGKYYIFKLRFLRFIKGEEI